jgi:PRTRC genetic system ThiF family protein
VEPHNLIRQNFFTGDVGKFKSQALAERLSRFYGRPVGYSVYPYDHEMVGEIFGGGMYKRAIQGIIIGCVDNAAARRAIANTLQWGNWWLDAGNGHHSGQVLLGNARDVESLKGSFNERDQTVRRLPIPSLQLPSLLSPVTEPTRERRDCAEAIEAEDQSPTINQAMATLVLEFIYRLLKGALTWMGAYIDLDAGTLQTVPAEPETVARICGIKVDSLVADMCPTCGKKHL